ncbi:hypothetical protein GCM10022237_37020 [Nocardioides ginsengisoli]|uniref:Flp pilus-assembly TadG-like N-terminal domain-containing protein n=1 Tax=Nocardioides ginsengisoli TaxID=363868 RepID=A0ABW3VXL6_9ACTN
MRRTSPDERGAAAVLIAVLLAVVLLVSAAFAVDLGQQRVVRRDVQAVADMVALDMVRLLDGSKASAYDRATFEAAKNKSLARNDAALGGELTSDDVTWSFARRTEAGAWVAVANDSDEIPTAVKVSAKSDVGFAFGGVTGVDRGGAVRTAMARNEESACVLVGSFIASLNSGEGTLLNPILNGLLGSSLNLDLVSYKGLAGANVSLLDLVKVGGLGVGTVDELLALKNVEAAKIFVAAANVLQQQGKLAQANILRAITVAASTPTVAIGDLISAMPGSDAALNAGLNVLDLITATAFVANKNHAIDIPNLGINLSPLASVTTSLTVIESPRKKCGGVGTTAETAQIRLKITAKIPAKKIGVDILGVLGAQVSLDETAVTVDVDLGKALATLNEVHCNPAGPDYLKVALSSSVLGSAKVSASLGAHALITVPLLGSGGLLGQILSVLGLGSLLNPPEIKLDTGLALTAQSPGATNDSKTLTLPIPGAYTVPVGSGSGVILGPVAASTSGTTQLSINYGLLGNQNKVVLNADPLYNTVLNPILSAVAASLNPIVTTLQNALITPLSQLLGLQLGGADVFTTPTPTCKGPRLVG